MTVIQLCNPIVSMRNHRIQPDYQPNKHVPVYSYQISKNRSIRSNTYNKEVDSITYNYLTIVHTNNCIIY